MAQHEASIHIDAPPKRVWAVLAATDLWPQWVPNVSRVEGALVLGGRLTVHAVTKQPPFPLVVAQVEMPSLIRLEGRGLLGAFRGSRIYQLTASDGGTDFLIRERSSGPAAVVVMRFIKDLQGWFDSFVQQLKARAESAL